MSWSGLARLGMAVQVGFGASRCGLVCRGAVRFGGPVEVSPDASGCAKAGRSRFAKPCRGLLRFGGRPVVCHGWPSSGRVGSAVWASSVMGRQVLAGRSGPVVECRAKPREASVRFGGLGMLCRGEVRHGKPSQGGQGVLRQGKAGLGKPVMARFGVPSSDML